MWGVAQYSPGSSKSGSYGWSRYRCVAWDSITCIATTQKLHCLWGNLNHALTAQCYAKSSPRIQASFITTKRRRLCRVQTHASHSIAFNWNIILHFVTLWAWLLTFRANTKLKARTHDGLSLWQVWWWYSLNQFGSITRPERHRQTRINVLLPRLSSTWVAQYKSFPP